MPLECCRCLLLENKSGALPVQSHSKPFSPVEAATKEGYEGVGGGKKEEGLVVNTSPSAYWVHIDEPVESLIKYSIRIISSSVTISAKDGLAS